MLPNGQVSGILWYLTFMEFIMLQYMIRRTGYSVLILLGVLILTFVLFRVAAGDPAVTMLGKNPTPEEVESMREMLGSDKPLFWGNWKVSEIAAHTVFTGSHTNFPGVTYQGPDGAGEKGYHLSEGAEIRYRRNFTVAESGVRMIVKGKGDYTVSGAPAESPEEGIFDFAEMPEEVILKGGKDGADIEEVRFYRPTKHLFDSQAKAALEEIIHFENEFPYVSVFDFGKTLQTRESIRTKLWRGMWPSLFVMLPVFFGELFFGIVLAMLSCVWHGRWQDRVIMIVSVAGMSISYLALIIFGQWLLGYYWNLFPVWGWGDIRYLLLPVIIGIISGTGSGARFYRTVFLNEAGREYLRTARAKGVPSFYVYFKHMLKNAMVPIITRASTVLPFLFTGSLLLESFFGIPGLGYEGINALNDSDLQMLKALVILGAFLFVGINLLTDLAYAWVDPRMRPEK